MSDQPTPALQVAPDPSGHRITVTVANDGPEPIDPGVRRSTLLIDGQPCVSWSFAVMNGAGTTSERHLEPGKQVAIARVLPTSSLGGAGEHELIAEINGQPSLPVRTRFEE